MKYCTNCGASISEEKFCSECGTPVGIKTEAVQPVAASVAPIQTAPPTAASVTNEKRGCGSIMLIGLAAFAVFVVFYIVWMLLLLFLADMGVFETIGYWIMDVPDFTGLGFYGLFLAIMLAVLVFRRLNRWKIKILLTVWCIALVLAIPWVGIQYYVNNIYPVQAVRRQIEKLKTSADFIFSLPADAEVHDFYGINGITFYIDLEAPRGESGAGLMYWEASGVIDSLDGEYKDER
jgi:hypothetical protein